MVALDTNLLFLWVLYPARAGISSLQATATDPEEIRGGALLLVHVLGRGVGVGMGMGMVRRVG